ISVATVPSGAAVTVRRYEDGGRRALGAPQRLGPTPVDSAALAPGSYLMEVEAPGRAPVRYPVLLARGEPARWVLELPARLPPGMVFSPPGHALFGSAEAEPVRQALANQPQHPVWTDGYLIGRTEVTFGDWIDFLEAQGPDERRRHLPSGQGNS